MLNYERIREARLREVILKGKNGLSPYWRICEYVQLEVG
jgi:hypothetical protein